MVYVKNLEQCLAHWAFEWIKCLIVLLMKMSLTSILRVHPRIPVCIPIDHHGFYFDLLEMAFLKFEKAKYTIHMFWLYFLGSLACSLLTSILLVQKNSEEKRNLKEIIQWKPKGTLNVVLKLSKLKHKEFYEDLVDITHIKD